jgi:homoserine kinase type II
MAIYTTLSKKDVGKIVEEFALGDLLNFTGMRTGSVNTHYLIETKRGKFFLKIDEVKSEVETKQEIDLLLHLRKQNFPCVQPLKTKSGRFHLDFQGKCLTVTRHIEGVELPVESLNPTHLNALGHALAN